ncbi:MAG: hypothetical protein AVDCRST_MAG32-1218 [uncultured Nocardioides sp.]|uniref:Uncharacterized protein n=1 Tax=uncultured Nocardioides sp. TaxID=198441 RepID=A0A6J4N3B6_9ACTN|nr:MAG: hypothetical protein AVDCRST_MAG32-1218 [uncultured Nocardioides sp.]
MPVVDALKQRLARLRQRRPVVDHFVRALQHYGRVRGNALAAAVTYFAFLSFFPILALSFAVLGQLTKVYGGDVQQTLVRAANQVVPDLIGPPNGISLDTLQSSAPSIFSVGIVLTLYAGLGWLSGMREALETVFEEPPRQRPGFVSGKLRDVLALLVLGSVLIVAVAVSGVTARLIEPILGWLGLGDAAAWFLVPLAVLLGLAANTVLFFAFFRLLASPDVPARSLWSGAVLGAVVFELLKQLSTYLLGLTKNSDAFQAFGIALVLLVWINYFSRVVVFAAAWAQTTPEARALRDARVAVDLAVEAPPVDLRSVATASVAPPSSGAAAVPGRQDPRAAFAAGAAAMLALVAAVRRRRP